MFIICLLVIWSLPSFAAPTNTTELDHGLFLPTQAHKILDTCQYLQVDLMSLYSLATKQGTVVGELEKVTAMIKGKTTTVALIFKNKIAYTNPDVAMAQTKRCGRHPT